MMTLFARRPLIGTMIAAAVAVTAGLSFQGALRAQDARSLEERLRAAEDYIQIEQLLMNYAAALNTENADAYVAMFTPDAVFELRREPDQAPFMGPFVGRDAIRAQWFPDAPAEAGDPGAFRRFGPMRHVTTNYEINVDGDAATVRAFFMEVISHGANQPSGSNPPTIYQMGRYEDELVRRDGRWLFAKREVITDMNTAFEP